MSQMYKPILQRQVICVRRVFIVNIRYLVNMYIALLPLQNFETTTVNTMFYSYGVGTGCCVGSTRLFNKIMESLSSN